MTPPDVSPETITHLHWDSDFFGIKIGRINSHVLSPTAANSICEQAQSKSYRCLYWLASSRHEENLAAAAQAQFSFIDLRLELSASIIPQVGLPRDTRLRIARAEDELKLQEIARATQRDTRFIKDKNFPKDRAAQLYAEWVSKDLATGDTIVSIDDQDSPVGFISCSCQSSSNVGSISLLSVSTESSGQGLGRALVRAALQRCARLGCDVVEVVTQGTNIGAHRVYQSCGFRSIRSSLWFHRWF